MDKKVVQKILMRHESILVAAGWILLGIVGVLQMINFNAGFVTNYGADIMGPPVFYHMTRTKRLVLLLAVRPLYEKETFVLLATGCISWEWLQRFDWSGSMLEITKGEFDPFDLIAYILTLSACYYFDITNKRLSQVNLIQQNIKTLGISFPEPPQPGGSYVAVNTRGSIAYVAIQFPIREDKYYYIGKLGKEVSTEEGYEAAKMAAMNVLAQINKHVGFDKIVGLNHADIYYRAHEGWDEPPRVANGASDLFLHIMGDAGKHTRAIFGVEALPRGFCVALTTSFTIMN